MPSLILLRDLRARDGHRASKFQSRARALLALVVLLLGGCTSHSPVRVVPRAHNDIYRALDTCALHGDRPSARTSWVLRLIEAEDAFEDDPRGTLRVLHERVARESTRDGLFALAELSYLTGRRRQDAECYLAAAVYAYLYLFDEDRGPAPNPYDRRVRWACDIYNRSLVRAFKATKEKTLELQPGTRELPTGSLHVEVDLSAFPFTTAGLELLPAEELDVAGLSFRVRDSGLGAPLIAVVQRRSDSTAGVGLLDTTSVSASLFLRLHGGVADLASGMPAVLELHSAYDTTSVDVGGSSVPLEADPSATIAYGIESSNIWRYTASGLFRSRQAERANGMILPRPFEPGRIPVVLVHGTASNPAYWAELLNSLHADPLIRSRVQFWLFVYVTGNPVVYSAASLRESLEELVRVHDPEGRDDALRHMVVVGHSQGGLLTKMLTIRLDADELASAVLGATIDELDVDQEAEALLRRCFDFEPLPFVDRVVFVATPHRGSFLAARWFSRFFAKLIAVPRELESTTRQIVTGASKERLPLGLESRVPTSLDNMDPSSPVLRYIADVPMDPRIEAHSIIPIGKADEPAGATDGVVAYESAHIEGVASECLVPSKHSCQSHPRTIIELRRILREHIAALDAR